MALIDAIASLQTPGGPNTPGTYTITRYAAGPYTKGRYAALGPQPLTIADDIVEGVDAVLDVLALTAHGLQTGDGPVRLTTTGTLPAGLALATDYWVVRLGADVIGLAATLDDAQAMPTAALVDITNAGTGTHTLVDVPSSTLRQNVEYIALVGSVQPVSGRDLQELSEGQNADEVRVVYTGTKIQTRVPGYEPDELELDDDYGNPEIYYCFRVERHQAFGTHVHYRGWFSRTEVP